MNLIKLTHDNLEQEHICCAIANKKDIQVMSKKNWLKERLDEGLVFLKGDVRGKFFIEYIPAEYAWTPIEAKNYMFINCLWISGQFKGHGYSNLLLERCIEDSKAKGKKGLVILSSKKKMGFLSDPKFLKYKGFETADTAEPYFILMYLPFAKKSASKTSNPKNTSPKNTAPENTNMESTDIPRFKNTVHEHGQMPKGFALYYTNQCPFTAKYVPLLENMAQERGLDFHAMHIQSREDAQNAPSPFTTFSLFYNGTLVTHEILSEKKFEKILTSLDL